MRKLLLFLLALFAVMQAQAYDVEIGGIYYNLNAENHEAEVTYESSSYNSYSGDVVIPASIIYSEETYSVTSIGTLAFYKSTGMTSITIPSSVMSVGGSAFGDCSGMTAVYITDLVSWCNISFGYGSNPLGHAHDLYLNGEKITNLVIPSGVTAIGDYAFYQCKSLTSLEIPNSVINIGKEAFPGCTGLNSVAIQEGMTTIGQYAFSGCTGLTSFTIPNSVTNIGLGAFSGCTGIVSIEIPENVTNIGQEAFHKCTGLTIIRVDSDNSVYDSRNSCNAIIETASNTLIQGCSNTTIPNGVISISNYACEGYTGLTSLEIPNSVTLIGKWAFYGCTGITSIEIPNSVTSIGSQAFYGCTNLSSITIPDDLSDIGGSAFSGTAWSNSQPYGLVYIGNVAYHYTYYAEYVQDPFHATFREGTIGIAGSCFSGIKFLTGATIPSSVKTIGDYAFSGCTDLYSLSIAEGVTTIGKNAFSGCKIEGVSIPNTVTFIGEGAFNGCSNLRSIVIPNSVTTIESRTFFNCYNMNYVTIPEGITSIGQNAFYNSGLYSVTIPSTVTAIGNSAFYKSDELSSVVSKIKSPFTFGEDCFIDISSSCVLTVPYGTTAAYEAAGWTTDVFGGGIVEAPQEDVTIAIGSAGIATYCYNHDLDFSNVEGLKAYIVSGFSPSTGKLVLTPITKVKAGEGLLLQGAEGTYEVPFTTTDMYYTNLLKGVTTATEISPTSSDETNFILANGKHGIGFYTLSETGELAAGKAYLHIPTSEVESMEARCFILNFENDEATGIIEHKSMTETNDCYYDMQGRRVLHPSRGIYIVNGKKVFIK